VRRHQSWTRSDRPIFVALFLKGFVWATKIFKRAASPHAPRVSQTVDTAEKSPQTETSACRWRIVGSPVIPFEFPVLLLLRCAIWSFFLPSFIATLSRLLGLGGARSLVAELLLLKHQLLIVNLQWDTE
jgi:hypothetical protein